MHLSGSLPLTHQGPLPGPDTHTVGCAGGELGPAAELTVLLTGQMAQLGERRHGAGRLQTCFNVCLTAVLLSARNGCRRPRESKRSEEILKDLHLRLCWSIDSTLTANSKKQEENDTHKSDISGLHLLSATS